MQGTGMGNAACRDNARSGGEGGGNGVSEGDGEEQVEVFQHLLEHLFAPFLIGLHGVEGEVERPGDFLVAFALEGKLVDAAQGRVQLADGLAEEEIGFLFNDVLEEKFLPFPGLHFPGIAVARPEVAQVVQTTVFDGGEEPRFEGFKGGEGLLAAVKFEDDVMHDVFSVVMVFEVFAGEDTEYLVILFKEFAVSFFFAPAELFEPCLFVVFHCFAVLCREQR